MKSEYREASNVKQLSYQAISHIILEQSKTFIMPVIKVEKGEFAVEDTVKLTLDRDDANLRFEQDGKDIIMHLALRLKNEDNIYIGETEVEADSLGVFKFGETNSFLEGGLEKLKIRFEPDEPNSGEESLVRLQTSKREFDMKTTGKKKESGAQLRTPQDKDQYPPT